MEAAEREARDLREHRGDRLCLEDGEKVGGREGGRTRPSSPAEEWRAKERSLQAEIGRLQAAVETAEREARDLREHRPLSPALSLSPILSSPRGEEAAEREAAARAGGGPGAGLLRGKSGDQIPSTPGASGEQSGRVAGEGARGVAEESLAAAMAPMVSMAPEARGKQEEREGALRLALLQDEVLTRTPNP